MTELASKILAKLQAKPGISAAEIFECGLGSSVHEVEFIVTQLRLFILHE